MLHTKTNDIAISADFSVIHFNGANRTLDAETTDATAIHPLSNKCEQLLAVLAKQNDLKAVNGVVLLSGLGSSIIDKLNDAGLVEHTAFTDTLMN